MVAKLKKHMKASAKSNYNGTNMDYVYGTPINVILRHINLKTHKHYGR